MITKLPITSIIVGKRMRQDLGPIEELMSSITELGIMQPPGVDQNNNLIWGGRRFEAMKRLGWTEIPVIRKEVDSESNLRILELEENVNREEMNWKDRCRSVAEIHNLALRDKHKNAEVWTRKHTARLLNVSEGQVAYCVTMSELLDKPDHPVQKADSLMEAFRILTSIKEDAAKARQAQLTSTRSIVTQAISLPSTIQAAKPDADLDAILNEAVATGQATSAAGKCVACAGVGKNSRGAACPICRGTGAGGVDNTITIPISRMLYRADAREFLAALTPESVDHIHTDPPYGIDMEHLNQQNPNGGMRDIDRVEATHQVDDNIALLAHCIPLLERVLKPGGFMVLWYDNVHWEFLRQATETVGLKLQRWPLVWCKTSSCQNQCAGFNWTKSTEFAIVARKGSAVIQKPQPTNYFLAASPDRSVFRHPFAKPTSLIENILSAFALPGQTILDPFCGSGTTLVAAANIGLTPIGCEIEETHFNEATLHVTRTFRDLFPNKTVKFV